MSSSLLAGGELVPLQLELIERPLSSRDDVDPVKLFERLRFASPASSKCSSLSSLCFCLPDEADSDDCVSLRLQRDWPDSRNPFANGLLSILSFVIRSFCNFNEIYVILANFMVPDRGNRKQIGKYSSDIFLSANRSL